MNSIYYDLILSGMTYVILTYLSFMLMKKRKPRSFNDDEGGIRLTFEPPEIDLPPGVCWPSSPQKYKEVPEEVY